jgi:hypothetical protein
MSLVNRRRPERHAGDTKRVDGTWRAIHLLPNMDRKGHASRCMSRGRAVRGSAARNRTTSGAHQLPAQILEVFEVLGGLHLERGARPGFHDRALETEEPNFVCCKLPSAAFNLPVAARRQMTIRAPKDE